MTKARDLANASTALSAVSATELAFVDGVTSAIQTQMDAKASLTGTETLTNKTLTSPVLTTPTISTVNAKGDLLAGTADNTVDRLAVGNNGETLVADSAATTGLRYSATPSASNPVLNSAMQVWQRGTSFSLTASTSNSYTADRWTVSTGANQATTISRQATGDTTNLPNIQYAMRVQRNSGQTGTGDITVFQMFETANTIPFAGKTVTLSFYAKAGANYSASASGLRTYLYTGTGTDQNIYTGYTGTAAPINNNVSTLTTTWQRFTVTGTIAATATEMCIGYYFTPTGTASTNDSFDITGVQIDIGSVALPFRTTGATIQGELAACQRYYNRYTNAVSNGQITGTVGYAVNTTLMDYYVVLPVQMRVQPTVLDYSNIQVYMIAAAINYTTGSWATAVSTYDPKIAQIRYTHGSAVFTAGQIAAINSQTTSGYVGLSAEL